MFAPNTWEYTVCKSLQQLNKLNYYGRKFLQTEKQISQENYAHVHIIMGI